MKKLLGTLTALSTIAFLFFSPVIWDRYKYWTGVDLDKSIGAGIVMVLVFTLVAIIGLAISVKFLDSNKD